MNKHLLLLATLAVAFGACKKDEEEPTAPGQPSGSTGTFRIDYGFHWGTGDFDMANTYTDGNGHAVKFTTVKFYLSHPELMNGTNEVAHFHDSYMLFDGATAHGSQTVGTMSPGSVTELRLTIGLDSLTNHADPITADFPLNIPGMHWSWNPAAGYKFLNLEGRVDNDGDGVVDDNDPSFTYHCATDNALREAALAFSGSVAAGGTLAPHLEIRMDLLVAGVDMLMTPVAMGYQATNAVLMDNLVTALVIE
jgi:hypothetical protein